MSFPQDIAPKPSLICVGTVTEVENGYLSDSENYYVIPVKISGLDASRDFTVNILYQPQWFTKEFNTIVNIREFKNENTGDKGYLKGSAWVYSTYINFIGDPEKYGDKSVAYLRGLCGSEAKYVELADRLFNLEVPEGSEGPSVEDVTECMREFLENNQGADGTPMRIGYILEQEQKDSGETDDNGRKIYVGTKNMVLPTNQRFHPAFFDVNAKQVKFYTKKAEKSETKDKVTKEPTGFFRYKMMFTEEVPF